MGDSLFFQRNRIDQLPKLVSYFKTMYERGRAAGVFDYKTGELKTLCTFFILNNEEAASIYYNRPMWSTPLDFPEGVVCYIDKMLGEFNRLIFKDIQRSILDRFPKIEKGIWFRPTKGDDRKVEYFPLTKRISLNADYISSRSSA